MFDMVVEGNKMAVATHFDMWILRHQGGLGTVRNAATMICRV